jgi:ABC-type transport system involved in multi-copper enzyme maturation permease subunit
MANEMYVVIGIGLCIFAFLALLLAIGEAYGGDWLLISQGVTTFIFIIVGFAVGCFALATLLRRHN